MQNTKASIKIFTPFILLLLSVAVFPQKLPTETSTLFSGSGNCELCHTSGTNTFTSPDGEDISPPTMWQSTMMANSSKDPFWQAKVTSEVALFPSIQSVIEDKCATCHMPMGRTEAIYHGSDHYTFTAGLNDPLSMDGVSCTVCHQINNTNMAAAASFSGGYNITDVHQIYGPFKNPTTAPMFNNSGYTPVESGHIKDSEVCATCHTLFTPYLDNDGNIAGYFPEQTPYIEWKNSSYSVEETECRDCHMQKSTQETKLAVSPPWLSTLRTPVYNHEFVGSNSYMYKLLGEHTSTLGLTTTTEQMDSSLQRTNEMLNNTIDLSEQYKIEDGFLIVSVNVKNLTGHKFPTGFPSRRTWINLKLSDDLGNTIFESGKFNSDGTIVGINETYEPHYDTLTRESQVQIYQAIMMDVDNEVTYTLLRGSGYIKDNRLPPAGFTKTHESYDTVAVHGMADSDPDFNLGDSGSDFVHYKIALNGASGNLHLKTDVYFQTIAPKFVDDLFNQATQKIDQFKAMYNSSDLTPILLKQDSTTISVSSIEEGKPGELNGFKLQNNYPNPFNPSTKISYNIKGASADYHHVLLEIFDPVGRQISTLYKGNQYAGNYTYEFNATNLTSGIYFYKLSVDGESRTKKMVLLK